MHVMTNSNNDEAVNLCTNFTGIWMKATSGALFALKSL